MSTTFTLYHDGQFWVGVLERHHDGHVRAVKVTFGAEPSDAELYEWLQEHGNQLFERLDHAAPVMAGSRGTRPRTVNPKRAIREAAKASRAPRASTAAQEALKADQEQRGILSAAARKRQRIEDQQRERALRREQAKKKRRGR